MNTAHVLRTFADGSFQAVWRDFLVHQGPRPQLASNTLAFTRGVTHGRTGSRAFLHQRALQQGADLGIWRAIWPMSGNRRKRAASASNDSCGRHHVRTRGHQLVGSKGLGNVIVDGGLEAQCDRAVMPFGGETRIHGGTGPSPFIGSAWPPRGGAGNSS